MMITSKCLLLSQKISCIQFQTDIVLMVTNKSIITNINRMVAMGLMKTEMLYKVITMKSLKKKK